MVAAGSVWKNRSSYPASGGGSWLKTLPRGGRRVPSVAGSRSHLGIPGRGYCSTPHLGKSLKKLRSHLVTVADGPFLVHNRLSHWQALSRKRLVGETRIDASFVARMVVVRRTKSRGHLAAVARPHARQRLPDGQPAHALEQDRKRRLEDAAARLGQLDAGHLEGRRLRHH